MATNTSKAKIRRNLSRSILLRLSRVREIDAVFTRTDENGICHVYSVVVEHRSDIYRKVMKEERRIEEEFPEVHFDFRVRAHQGRRPVLAVPSDSRVLFAR